MNATFGWRKRQMKQTSLVTHVGKVTVPTVPGSSPRSNKARERQCHPGVPMALGARSERCRAGETQPGAASTPLHTKGHPNLKVK